MRMFNPPHPGEQLREILDEMQMTVTAFAAHIGVARSTVNRVLAGTAGISADMSIRLTEAFGQPTRDLWFMMQADYDFWQASQAKRKPVQCLKVAA